MSRCPQCKASLPAPEVESMTASSHHTRSSRSAQQSAAKLPSSALTELSKRPTPGSTPSASAGSSHQPRNESGTDLQAKTLRQYPPPAPPVASSSRSHESTKRVVSTLQRPSTKSSDHQDTGAESSSAADSLERPTSSSQIVSTHASSPALSVADGRHPHRGTLVALDLQQYKNRNRGGRPPGESPRHAEWMRTADIMLEEVPSGRNWREKVMEMDSSITAAVTIGFALVPKGHESLTEDTERKELIRLVRRFAERHSEGRLNFQQFILVCLCQVLSSQGVPQGKIVETLQICISDTSKRNVGRFLKGATWANNMMNDLFFTDWSYRAVDLIAICKIFGEL